MAKIDKMVPGSYKDNASFQEKGYKTAPVKDIAFADTRVLDCDYPYDKIQYPGGMREDEALNRDMAKHKIHKPGK